MSTIANQIQRIQDSRDLLRTKGLELNLAVPTGTRYWDKESGTYKTTTELTYLTNTDQLDKIVSAFGSILAKHNLVIEVPLLIKTDGSTVVGESKTLDAGFYSGAVIKPYITVESNPDYVLNIENIAQYVITSQNYDIRPNKEGGFNYIGYISGTVQSGVLEETPKSFTNTSIVANISQSGWIDSGEYTIKVPTAKLHKQVGSDAASEITSNAVNISPDATNNTVVTISRGIYDDDRTITIAPALSQSSGTTASVETILEGYTAWSNGFLITGTMPNHGGDDSVNYVDFNTDKSLINYNGRVAVPTVEGYYNEQSAISTNILWNIADSITFDKETITNPTISSTIKDTSIWFETIPAGYYATLITRKIQVLDAVGSVNIDYDKDEATFTTNKEGWVRLGEVAKATINAGSATYVQTENDLSLDSHSFTIKPSSDGYLKEVTIRNTLIYQKLSEI